MRSTLERLMPEVDPVLTKLLGQNFAAPVFSSPGGLGCLCCFFLREQDCCYRDVEKWQADWDTRTALMVSRTDPPCSPFNLTYANKKSELLRELFPFVLNLDIDTQPDSTMALLIRFQSDIRFLVKLYHSAVAYSRPPRILEALRIRIDIQLDREDADFLKAVETAHSLATYQAPLSAREKQLESVGAAAVRIAPVMSLMLDESSPIFRETLFQARSLYHHICNPNNVKSYSYPHGYSEVRDGKRLRRLQLLRLLPPAPVVAPVVIPPKADKEKEKSKRVTRSKKVSGTVEESEDEVSIITGADEMNVDDDSSVKASQSTKSSKEGGRASSGSKKKDSNKRARVDSTTQFHEDTFLTAATAEFYSAAANVQGVVDDAIGAASMPTDFETNSLALRKRMYHIMVELAVIHEQLRSHLARRSQLVEEGEAIKDLLSNLPESAALGVDSMVP
ncbi:hypothetical protein B0H14DRAFT_2591603 [Mycena olivaceomarginata]|nr:hypothetical protein B0H14DRAFT_2591603 [Mycena olivaceomarginata]